MKETIHMTIANEIFRKAGLTPTATQVGPGYCRCDPRTETILYKTNGNIRCDVCSSLNQAYPAKDGGSARMTDGSFLLITPQAIMFWGSCKLNLVNPRIAVKAATGELSGVLRELIINPPEAPWTAYAFSKSNSSATIRVTEDNRMLRFGGKVQIRKRLVTELNRDQVMQMYHVGMTWKEWDAFMTEYATDKSRRVMVELERKYPALGDIRWMPPLDSPEYLALSFILPKGKAKETSADV